MLKNARVNEASQAMSTMGWATVATCNLNQWAMDFDGNYQRIKQSIDVARAHHARYRIGPELEVSGYGCEDHFLELDTFTHTWEVIAALIDDGYTDDILIDLGAPIMHCDVAYNCRILLLNREVLLIRPKSCLADNGNYREPRWFRPWPVTRPLEHFRLPSSITGDSCPIGHALVQLSDGVLVGCETCEELWTPRAPHIALSLAGAHIIGNGSASHHALRKLDRRLDVITSATRKTGGVYLYANQRGCDGGRLYFDGCSLIALNGDVLCMASQFAVGPDVEVVAAVVDIDDVVSYRARHAARGEQAALEQASSPIPRVLPKRKPFALCTTRSTVAKVILPTAPLPKEELMRCSAEEEVACGPACWLWDYLRRSGLNGFFLALSGGADSSATLAIVASMCHLVVRAVSMPGRDTAGAAAAVGNGSGSSGNGDIDDEERERRREEVLRDVRRITGADSDYVPKDPRELANRMVHTAYMPCGSASSSETQRRARSVAHDVGSYHMLLDIAQIVDSALNAFVAAFSSRSTTPQVQKPRFRTRGGSNAENLALQNVQARTRMVMSYVCAQLSLWARGRKGSLLVLGSSNVDECLRGYLTKYDCSSADLNPIGGISKKDLRAFLLWAAATPDKNNKEKYALGLISLLDVVAAPPTAELEPIENGHVQTDEQDMGMTYDDLSWYGRLRKLSACGPLSMFRKLATVWHGKLNIMEIAKKVKFFFRMYSINRHKVTTLTPSYHAENYSPEDNRFDLRQFLYNTRWKWQFDKIDEEVKRFYSSESNTVDSGTNAT